MMLLEEREREKKNKWYAHMHIYGVGKLKSC